MGESKAASKPFDRRQGDRFSLGHTHDLGTFHQLVAVRNRSFRKRQLDTQARIAPMCLDVRVQRATNQLERDIDLPDSLSRVSLPNSALIRPPPMRSYPFQLFFGGSDFPVFHIVLYKSYGGNE